MDLQLRAYELEDRFGLVFVFRLLQTLPFLGCLMLVLYLNSCVEFNRLFLEDKIHQTSLEKGQKGHR